MQMLRKVIVDAFLYLKKTFIEKCPRMCQWIKERCQWRIKESCQWIKERCQWRIKEGCLWIKERCQWRIKESWLWVKERCRFSLDNPNYKLFTIIVIFLASFVTTCLEIYRNISFFKDSDVYINDVVSIIGFFAIPIAFISIEGDNTPNKAYLFIGKVVTITTNVLLACIVARYVMNFLLFSANTHSSSFSFPYRFIPIIKDCPHYIYFLIFKIWLLLIIVILNDDIKRRKADIHEFIPKGVLFSKYPL